MTARVYIAVEGTKGSGKSELLRALRERLQASGTAFVPLDVTVPGATWSPLEILARFAVFRRFDGFEEALYRSRARWHARRAFSSDARVILGDRSLLTPIVTRWWRANTLGVAGWVDRCAARAPELPAPDLVLWLRVPPELAAARCAARGRTYGRRSEQLSAIREEDGAYASLRDAPPPALAAVRWVALDGACPRGAVVEQAWFEIQQFLGRRS